MPFPTLGVPELLLLTVIVLAVFGGGKIAGVGKSLGTAINEFKGALKEGKEEAEDPDKKKERIVEKEDKPNDAETKSE